MISSSKFLRFFSLLILDNRSAMYPAKCSERASSFSGSVAETFIVPVGFKEDRVRHGVTVQESSESSSSDCSSDA